MPIVSVMGTSSREDKSFYEKIESSMKSTVASIKELKLKRKQVSVRFPKDNLEDRDDQEIIVEVEGLFQLPERTDEVREKLAKRIVAETAELFPEATLIECIVIPFDPAQGFASFARE